MRITKAHLADLQARLTVAYPGAKCALDHQNPFELVVATILSAQCTDARVNLTTPALFRRYPDAANLAAAALPELEALIHATGFYRNKAKNLVGLGQALMARHGGVVPDDARALAALPGVGQKTANVVLANAFGVPALAVDTHIFRVARRLGLSEANTPEKVEADLCRRFPASSWIDLHHRLIFHGRRCCDARKPLCADCPVLDLCPTGRGRIPDPHTGLTRTPLEGASLKPALPAAAAPAHDSGPRRIVSLVPSVTELLTQWDLGARLVGRTRYCIAPRWIRATVPAVGGTKDPDLERIRDLSPDLVILEKDENPKAAAEALTALDIPWLALDLRTVKGVAGAWRQLGALLGAADRAEDRAAALEASLPKRTRKGPRALTLVWREPWIAAGEDTYVADLVRQAGFTPVGGTGYPRLEDADFEALAPDLILLPTEPYRFNERHAAALRAQFPETQVRVVDGQALTWYLSRTEQGLELLRTLREDCP